MRVQLVFPEWGKPLRAKYRMKATESIRSCVAHGYSAPIHDLKKQYNIHAAKRTSSRLILMSAFLRSSRVTTSKRHRRGRADAMKASALLHRISTGYTVESINMTTTTTPISVDACMCLCDVFNSCMACLI